MVLEVILISLGAASLYLLLLLYLTRYRRRRSPVILSIKTVDEGRGKAIHGSSSSNSPINVLEEQIREIERQIELVKSQPISNEAKNRIIGELELKKRKLSLQ